MKKSRISLKNYNESKESAVGLISKLIINKRYDSADAVAGVLTASVNALYFMAPSTGIADQILATIRVAAVKGITAYNKERN